MKDKILYLVLGILIGAVITAGCFLVFSKSQRDYNPGERPDMSDMSEMRKNGNFVKSDSAKINSTNTVEETSTNE